METPPGTSACNALLRQWRPEGYRRLFFAERSQAALTLSRKSRQPGAVDKEPSTIFRDLGGVAADRGIGVAVSIH